MPYYAQIILPIRLNIQIFYTIPEELQNSVGVGKIVEVNFSNKQYFGVIYKILESNVTEYSGNIKPILSVYESFEISQKDINLWEWICDYYMCTMGEVYKSALSGSLIDNLIKPQKKVKKSTKESYRQFDDRDLSAEQQNAIKQIRDNNSRYSPSLLVGVTGSGKTEIYIQLAIESLKKGENVLYLLPEKAISRELSKRLERVFKDSLLIYHSGQTNSKRASVIKDISNKKQPFIILGLRSAIFIPNLNPGLIIVDEEHDSSYKQNDPSPRYNARDCAVFISKLHKCSIVLGSATPTLESLLNVKIGKYSAVYLNNSFHGTEPCKITILNTIKERQKGAFNKIFPDFTIKEISKRLEQKQQILIFRNRRSYSPIVQCMYCGAIPKCPHCNVSLSYHKSINKLSCHFCGKSINFNPICIECSKPGLIERGCGTEMLEEKLITMFPSSKIARFDAQTTSSKKEELRILNSFSNGDIDILVGTQMIGKGFDFGNLNLIVVMQADSLISAEDFRANEKAIQQLTQIAGRSGRREIQGEMIIHTSIPDHIVFNSLNNLSPFYEQELIEREKYLYPPFIKIIKLTLRDKSLTKIEKIATSVSKKLTNICNINQDIISVNGPFSPAVDRVRDHHIVNFIIKVKKSSSLQISKGMVLDAIESLLKESGYSTRVIFDVDPY